MLKYSFFGTDATARIAHGLDRGSKTRFESPDHSVSLEVSNSLLPKDLFNLDEAVLITVTIVREEPDAPAVDQS